MSYLDAVLSASARAPVAALVARVLLFRRRLKSVADVLKGIRNKGFTQSRWNALLGYWVLSVVMVRVVLFPHFILGIVGFLRIFMASISGCLIPLSC